MLMGYSPCEANAIIRVCHAAEKKYFLTYMTFYTSVFFIKSFSAIVQSLLDLLLYLGRGRVSDCDGPHAVLSGWRRGTLPGLNSSRAVRMFEGLHDEISRDSTFFLNPS